jgi:hypothetical protein
MAGIKMVPSDPSISLFSDWHAQSELGTRCRRDVGPLLPAATFGRLRIDALVLVRFCTVPVEACLSMRPFTLRQRPLIFQPASAAGSTLLACIFEAT